MIARFVLLALGYWRGETRKSAWLLSLGFLICLIGNTYMALAVNKWSKTFFDALQTHEFGLITHNIFQLGTLAIGIGAASIATTQCRMRLQIGWRLWLTDILVGKWLGHGVRRACAISPVIDNPEARIADDGRLSIELFVDLVGGIVNIFLVSAVFIVVLWKVGGSYELLGIVIPGYLVLAVVGYSILTSLCMWTVGRPLVARVEGKAEAEANFRYSLTRVRHDFETELMIGVTEPERATSTQGGAEQAEARREAKKFQGLLHMLAAVWNDVINRQTKVIFLTHANNLLAPVVPLLLGAPKYLSGDMSLGDLMQAAAAFLQVQLSLNWLADNALSIANWSASARRVGALDLAMNMNEAEENEKRSELVYGHDHIRPLEHGSVSVVDL